jgi:hypothetical protein
MRVALEFSTRQKITEGVMSQRSWMLSILLAASLPLSAAAAVYKCPTGSGQITYQDTPCDASTAPSRGIEPRRVDSVVAAARPSAAPTSTSAEDRRRRDAVLTALMQKAYCEHIVPGFHQHVAAPFAAWRQRNAAVVQRLEADPDYREQIARYIEVRSNRTKSSGAGTACDDSALEFMPVVPSKPDERLASPARTWETYVHALTTGDRQTARLCLGGTAEERLGGALEMATPEQMKAMSVAYTNVRVMTERGAHVEATGLRKDGREGIIRFQSTAKGWKISEL